MSDLTEKELEAHTIYNSAGTQIAVTCLECNRVLDGTTPRLCGDCAKEARAEARVAAKEDSHKDDSHKDD